MSKKILVTEDSPTMRAMIAAAIESMGDYEVIEAANGFEALRMLPQQRFDLVITDINMPDINGLELVSFIRKSEQYRSLPLIIVSTEGSARDREKGLSLGADAYLVKPFDPRELQDLVRGLIAEE